MIRLCMVYFTITCPAYEIWIDDITDLHATCRGAQGELNIALDHIELPDGCKIGTRSEWKIKEFTPTGNLETG